MVEAFALRPLVAFARVSKTTATLSQQVFPQLENNNNETECEVVLDPSSTFITEELNQAPEVSFLLDDDDGDDYADETLLVDREGLTGDDDLHWFRFGGVGRLYEDDSNTEEQVLNRLKTATVAVIGMGGIGR